MQQPSDGDHSVSEPGETTNIEVHFNYTAHSSENPFDKAFLPRVPAVPRDLDLLAGSHDDAELERPKCIRPLRLAPKRRSTFELFETTIDREPAAMSSEKASNPKDKLEAQIKSADMTEDMQQEAIDIAQEAMSKYSIEKDIAMHIKKTFDDRKGPTWHCIVGRNFGSFVTHETKHFIYFYLGHCAILLFKTQ